MAGFIKKPAMKGYRRIVLEANPGDNELITLVLKSVFVKIIVAGVVSVTVPALSVC
ncbi:MAG: hypothetical protein R3F48_14240 [Candidatus Zixiibacteriota bacterium]